MSLTALKRERGGYRSYFTTLIDSTNLQINSNDETTSLQNKLKFLKNTFNTLTDLDKQIVKILSESDSDKGVEECEREIYSCNDLKFENSLKIQKIEDFITNKHLNDDTTFPSLHSENTISQHDRIFEGSSRLPKLNMLRFNGEDVRLWNEFFDNFHQEIHCKNLSDATKCRYLLGSLDGKAKERVRHFRPSADSYNDVLDKLKKDFGDVDKIKNCHIESLMNIKAPMSGNSFDLRKFLDSVLYDCGSLKHLGLSMESYGQFVISSIFKKLPMPLQSKIFKEADGKLPDMSIFLILLEREVKMMEDLIDLNHTESSHSHSLDCNRETVGSAYALPANNITPIQLQKRSSKIFCVFCNCYDKHLTSNCLLTVDKKMEITKQRNLCFNCLKYHFPNKCFSKFRCAKCNRFHHTSLHDHPMFHKLLSKANTLSRVTDTANISNASLVNSSVMLKTAQGVISSAQGNSRKVKILFDEGAQSSYLITEVANSLFLESHRDIKMKTHGFGGGTTEYDTKVVNINVYTSDGIVDMEVIVIPEIVKPIDRTGWSKSKKMSHVEHLTLADEIDDSPFEVQLLIGSNYAWNFIHPTTILGSGPVAQPSSLGYLLSGPIQDTYLLFASTSSSLLSFTCFCPDLVEFPIDPTPCLSGTVAEDSCLHDRVKLSFHQENTSDPLMELKNDFDMNYRKGLTFDHENQQYIARLPWKMNHPPLSDNLILSKKRLWMVRERLLKYDLFNSYTAIIEEHKEKRYIEEVDSSSNQLEACHYLPHFFVLRPGNETTPIRIVFAANSGTPSLNDCLETGPCLLNNLVGLLFKFRIRRIGLIADISRAFLCIQIAEQDRNFLRFLWFENNDPNGRIIIFRYRCLTFGPTCAPYILNSTIAHHLSGLHSLIAKDLKSSLYVDNLVTSVDSSEEALSYFEESRSILQNINMTLRQWMSNDSNVMEEACSLSVSQGKSIPSVLGVFWDPSTDEIQFPQLNISINSNKPCTKRCILSSTSIVFDPFGFLSPVLLLLKLFVCRLWEENHNWDDELPCSLVQEFNRLAEEVELSLKHFRIPRWFGLNSSEAVELHVFADASMVAFGCVSFLVQGSEVVLLGSKFKVVSQSKASKCTIPRLELEAMVLATNFLAKISSYIIAAFPHNTKYYWTDSEVALHWLYSTRKLQPIIHNRVSKILEKSNKREWSHVVSSENPADMVTRGLAFKQFISSELWLFGPSWLKQKQRVPWRHEDPKGQAILVGHSETTPSQLIDFSRMKSYHSTLRVLTFVLRFVRSTRSSRNETRSSSTYIPSADELSASEQVVVGLEQKRYFSVEIQALSENSSNCRKHNLVHSLNLFLDRNGLLRAGGRLHNSSLGDDAKFPLLIPKHSPLTHLIIQHFHHKVHHLSVAGTLSAINQRFWITSGRSTVRSVLRRCTVCKRIQGRPFKLPESPPLPEYRVFDQTPFSSVGIDYTGHLLYKDNTSAEGFGKAYILIFSCCRTRYINVELVKDMSVETFLLAFRSHCADYSYPKLVVSDNAPTFKRADVEVQTLFELLEADKTTSFLSDQGIKFLSIPVKSPWWGGFYERMIGVLKSCLRKVLGRSLLRFEDLRVLLREIRTSINCRPITYLSSNPLDLRPLTPCHLLFGFNTNNLPNPLVSSEDLNDCEYSTDHIVLNSAAKRRSLLHKHFQQRFESEYFSALRERHAYNYKGGTPGVIKTGDVVIVHETNKPRSLWKMAIVKELHKGADNQVRAATLQTANGQTNRAISLLYPLEITVPEQVNETADSRTTQAGRPRREAARQAIEKIFVAR